MLARHGGSSAVRDEGLLRSALARPLNRAGYGDPDLGELAALYAIAITRNHPFVDGSGVRRDGPLPGIERPGTRGARGRCGDRHAPASRRRRPRGRVHHLVARTRSCMEASMPDDHAIIEALRAVSSATITTILLKKGLRNIWMRGTRPIRPGQPRLVGRAFTLRFIPAREDLATPESWSSPDLHSRRDRGDAGGLHRRGRRDGRHRRRHIRRHPVRAHGKRGVAALVTDGVVRDLAGVLGTGLPVWCQGAAAPPSVAGLTFVNWRRADRLRRGRRVP